MKNGLKTLAMWLILGIIFIVVVSAVMENSETKMEYSELLVSMGNGTVEQIELNSEGTKAYVTLKNSNIEKEVNIPSLDSFMNEANEYLIEGNISLKQASESILITILSLLSPFAIAIVFLLFWVLFMGAGSQGGGNKTMSFGKSRARMMGTTEKSKITFKDVAGVDEEKEELQEIVEFLNVIEYLYKGIKSISQ